MILQLNHSDQIKAKILARQKNLINLNINKLNVFVVSLEMILSNKNFEFIILIKFKYIIKKIKL
jgi:hypothetical protein